MDFIENFILFLTMKEFRRSVKFWPSYSKLNLARFWDTVYIVASYRKTTQRLYHADFSILVTSPA